MNLATIVNNGHRIHIASQGPLRLRRGSDGIHQVARVMFLPNPVEVYQMPDGAPVYEFGDGTTIIDRKGDRQILPPQRQSYDADEPSPSVYDRTVANQGYLNGTPTGASEEGIHPSAHRTHGHRSRLGLLAVSGLLAACNTILVSPNVGTPDLSAPTQPPVSQYQGNSNGGAEGNTAYTPPAAPVLNSPPRIIAINAPKLVLVGQPVTLEAVVAATDGDPFELTWEQKKNPDQYVGTDSTREYVSGTDIHLQTDGTIATFASEWPGKYRVQATVSDKDGETAQTIDVLVKFETPPFEIRGVAINLTGSPRNNDFRLGRELIDRAESIGANYIQFSFVHFMEMVNSNEIQPCYVLPAGEQWCTTPPMDWLRDQIFYARSKGMGVELKPGLVVERGKKGTWQIAPTNSAAWFRSYTNNFILPYAQL
ncbi:hypothetical protein HYV82_04635, partial [Candidatus Woesearchaeota archaeon]|nr:hypothetical protein [Candidatus Woesearchaeota archaeon]